MDDLPDIHVRLSVWRLGLVMAGLALLALAGVWQVMSEDGVTARSGGGVLAVICGVIAILAGRRLLRGDTLFLTITRTGVVHPRAGLIPWHEIERVDVYRPAGPGKMLGIWVRDPDALQARMARGGHSPTVGLLGGFRAAGDASIAVPGLVVDKRLSTIRAEMERRARRRLAG